MLLRQLAIACIDRQVARDTASAFGKAGRTVVARHGAGAEGLLPSRCG